VLDPTIRAETGNQMVKDPLEKQGPIGRKMVVSKGICAADSLKLSLSTKFTAALS